MSIGVVAVLLLALTGCSSSSSSSASSVGSQSAEQGGTTIEPTASAQHPARELAKMVVASIKVPPSGDDLLSTVGFGSIWIADYAANAVIRIDPTHNQIAAVIHNVSGPCGTIGIGFGSVWVPQCGGSGDLGIARISAATNKITDTALHGRCCPGDSQIAIGDGSVWMAELTNGSPGDLARIDPTTDKVIATVHVATNATVAAYGSGAVWVSEPDNGSVARIDPSTNHVTTRIRLQGCTSCSLPGAMTTTSDSVWVMMAAGDVARIQTSTNRVAATIPAHVNHAVIFAGAGAVWISGDGVPLTRIDAKTGQITAQYTGTGANAATQGFGAIWMPNPSFSRMWRINAGQ